MKGWIETAAVVFILLVFGALGARCAVERAEERGRMQVEQKMRIEIEKREARLNRRYAEERKAKADELRESTMELDKALEENRKWILAARANRRNTATSRELLDRLDGHGL